MTVVLDDTRQENLFTLSSLRKRLGLRQVEVAQYMGMTRYEIQALEKDSSKLSYEKAKKFAKLYNVPLDLIFFGEEFALSELLQEKVGYK